MDRHRKRHLGKFSSGLAFLLVTAIFTSCASASGYPTIAVDSSHPLATIPSTAYGLNTAAWDAHLLDASVPGLIRNAGIDILRFPGGSAADWYHWQDNSVTEGQSGGTAPDDTFDNFMNVVKSAKAGAMITVNYGSNKSGTAGASPQEAAAWVAYAKRKHYGVKYWEIGNEVYGNGEYGAQWETDLHANHSPATYAKNSLLFIRAMKRQDPSIQIGVVLTAPWNWPDENSGLTPPWNSTVLKAIGKYIDFVDVHWYPQEPKSSGNGVESDAGLLTSTSQIPKMVKQLQKEINTYCGANAKHVRIALTETNSVSSDPGKQTTSIVNALFLADDELSWLEQGVMNVSWWDLHNSINLGNEDKSLAGSYHFGDYGVLSSGDVTQGTQGQISEPPANTPFPAYYAMTLLAKAARPGDTFLPAHLVAGRANSEHVVVYAIHTANGTNLILINDSKSQALTVNIAASLQLSDKAISSLHVSTYTGGKTVRETRLATNGLVKLQPYSLTTVTTEP